MKDHLTNRKTWLRGGLIVLFAVFWCLAQLVLAAVVLFQLGTVLVTGERNTHALTFAAQLARWLFEVALYAAFWRDQRPWPFADWPEAPSIKTPQQT